MFNPYGFGYPRSMLTRDTTRTGALSSTCLFAACLALVAGCNDILGIGEPVPAGDTATTLGGGGTGGGGTGGTVPTGGAGGGPVFTCDPAEKADPEGVFVSKLVGSASGDGSPTSPYDTLIQGLAEAEAQGKTKVYVAPGTYEGAASVPAGMTIEGGWLLQADGTWARDCAEGVIDKVRITAPADAPAVVTADKPGSPVLLRYLSVHTADSALPAGADAPGHSLVGVLVTGGAELTLDRALVVAGDGSSGGVATPGMAGAAAAANCTLGNNQCSNLAVGTPGPDGPPGDTGPEAMSGVFSDAGAFTPGDGSAGVSGQKGAAGGKGGAASCLTAPGHAGCITGCSPQCTPYYGNDPVCSTAGKCGCGGEGGTGGLAGRGGGASVALLVAGAGSRATVTASRLETGKGGDGSDGGAGGPGGKGSNGVAGQDSGYCIQESCKWDGSSCQVDQVVNTTQGGAKGGTGGTGGPGGAGSRGAGGPSLAVAVVAGATVDVSPDCALLPGSGGAGLPAGESAEIFQPR